MSSNIPKARLLLRKISGDLDMKGFSAEAKAIRKVVRGEMYRASPVKVAPVTSQKVTTSVRNEIIQLADMYPDWSNQKIANEVKVNPGRVSEVLAGK